MTDIEAALGELLTLCQKHNLSSEDLDSLVYDITDQKASAINNGGEDAQLLFLLEQNDHDINTVQAMLEHLAEEVTTEGDDEDEFAVTHPTE